MRPVLKKIIHSSPQEIGFLIEAFVCLMVARIMLKVLPFRRVSPFIGGKMQASPMNEMNASDLAMVRRISWAVQAIAGRIPFGFVCLTQGIAAKWMLRRRGISNTLYLGLRQEQSCQLKAHAWLRAGDKILTGFRAKAGHHSIAYYGDNGLTSGLSQVCDLVGVALGTRKECALIPVEGAANLAAIIRRHRLGAFLQARLPLSTKATLPPLIATFLQEESRNALSTSLSQVSEVLRLTNLLQESGIPALSIKGPLLSKQLYGEFGLRHASDIDLLISPSDLERADQCLRANDYSRSRPDFELTPRQKIAYPDKDFEYISNHPQKFRVEIMWRLAGLEASAFSEPVSFEIGRETVQAPPLNLTAIYLFQHGAWHGWNRLFWLVDVAHLLHSDKVEWESIWQTAKSLRLERALLQGVGLTEELFSVSPPASFQHSESEAKKVIRLVSQAKRQLNSPVSRNQKTWDFLREVWYRVKVRKDWIGKRDAILIHLHSIRSWKALRLPDAFFFLYYPLGPFLWMWRRITRLKDQ